MNGLEGIGTVVVSQKKEWGEILSGFETKNSYTVLDESGGVLYMAREEEGSLLARLFLKALRPFTLTVASRSEGTALTVRRPFRFMFHRADIFDGQGRLLGSIQKRFTLLRRKYSVLDSQGREAATLFGPILHPWTFEIWSDGRKHGKITKEWSGLLKEAFTDADVFGVTFPPEWDPRLKAIFLGAVFLIDFVHFENKGKERN